MKKIIIIGGGIGGLTTAIALLKKGFEVEVFEQASEIKEVGAGILIAANALNVFDRLGLAEGLIPLGQKMDKANVVQANGKKIMSIDMKEIELKHKFGTIAIHRADLQGFLYKNISKNIIKTGHVFSHYEEKNETIIAHFSNGFQTEGDILIAADGIHSKVREQLLGKIKYRYSGQTCWRFITDFQLNDQNTAYEYWANQAGLRVGTVQINDKQVYTFITEKTASGGKDDKISIKKELLERCEVFNDEIKNIIQNTDSQRIIRNDIFDFKPIKKWHHGKVVLLGDAAHATTPNMGQGACQAIEDAYAIAECLAKAENATSAFEKFQKSRIEKAHYVVNTSWMIGKITNISGFLKKIVVFLMAMTPKSVNERQFEKIYELNY